MKANFNAKWKRQNDKMVSIPNNPTEATARKLRMIEDDMITDIMEGEECADYSFWILYNGKMYYCVDELLEKLGLID